MSLRPQSIPEFDCGKMVKQLKRKRVGKHLSSWSSCLSYKRPWILYPPQCEPGILAQTCSLITDKVQTGGRGDQYQLWLHRELDIELRSVLADFMILLQLARSWSHLKGANLN